MFRQIRPLSGHPGNLFFEQQKTIPIQGVYYLHIWIWFGVYIYHLYVHVYVYKKTYNIQLSLVPFVPRCQGIGCIYCHTYIYRLFTVPICGTWVVSSEAESKTIVDGSEIRHQLRLVVEIPLFTGFGIHLRWLALGFLNHQQYHLSFYSS